MSDTRMCNFCGDSTADWVDPDWAPGPICRTCESKHDPHINWQSRALAAEQERDQLKAELATVERIWGTEAQKFDAQIADLKAELQQARELEAWVLEYRDRLLEWTAIFSDLIGFRLRSILERIEKEKK